jgi:hypothetical protein
MCLTSVVLPAPFSPTIPTSSSLSTERLTPFRAVTPFWWTNVTSLNSMRLTDR